MEADSKLMEDQVVDPKILYYGTPVVLVSTWNKQEGTNITPMSSSWALDKYVVLGLSVTSKGLENLRQHPECVLNLPSPAMWKQVEALAPLTGKNPVPAHKQKLFRYEPNKFSVAGFKRLESDFVKPERIAECPLQMEAKVQHIRVPEYHPHFAIIEVEVVRVHAHQDIVMGRHHIDPRVWSPLIYNFRHYFGLGPELGKTFRSET